MLLKQILDPTLLPREIAHNFTLVRHWSKRQLALRYVGSYLGYLWTFAMPLLMLLVYTFVFGIIFKARWNALGAEETTGNFAVIMFCGMSIYNIFSEAISTSARCVVDNPNLVKKVVFPLAMLPVSQTLASFAIGQLWFALVLLGAYFMDMPLHWTIFLFPLVLVPLALISLGCAFFVSALTVYLRDIPHLVGIILQIMFFLTPIFYPETMVPEKYRAIMYYNPMTHIVQQGRELLLFGQIPDPQGIALVWGVSMLVCQLGYVWFLKVKKGFADVI